MVHPRHLTVITIMLGIALSVLDTTTIALGLSTMARDPGVSADLSTWIAIRLRISVIPKRWPARRRYARELGVHPDVIENPPDLRAFGNKPDQAHLPTAHWS